MILRGPWREEYLAIVEQAGVVELEANTGRLWVGQDLSFLRELRQLVAITLLERGIPHLDLTPLGELTSLIELRLMVATSSPIDYSQFPHLRRCFLEWKPGVVNLFTCAGLTHLGLDHPPAKLLVELGNLPLLQELSLFTCPVRSLDSLGSLNHLRSLRLANLRKLEGNDFLAQLGTLRWLQVQQCTGFNDLSPLAHLRDLEELFLESVGKVNSLRPLFGLKRLRKFHLYGRSTLLDDDLSLEEVMPQLEQYGIVGATRSFKSEPKR